MIVSPILHLRRKVTAAVGVIGLTLGALTVSASSEAACTYTVTNEWSNGFNAAVKITNTTNAAISGWSVNWQYSGNNRATSAWSANLSGNNPYTAANLSWNGVIQPNQYVEFGVQGTKQAGAAEIPTLAGSVCGNTHNGTAGRVYIQIDKADDHLFLYVDGVEKMRWSLPDSASSFDGASLARLGEKIDITHLLAQGENQIRLVAAADNGEYFYGGYAVKLWNGNQLLVDAAEDVFSGPPHNGIMFEETVNIELADAPEKQILTINSNLGEAIYLNNVFTGQYAPAMFELAPGDYRVGLGESTVTADHPNNTVHITGRFREQDIQISSADVTLDAAQVPVRDKVNVWRVALVPYTTVYQGLTRAQANAGVLPPANDIGHLTADDIVVAEKSLNVTSEKWLLPMSYGLMKWDITVLPAVTQPVYHPYDEGIGHEFRWNPSMVNADLSQYDMVVHLIPTRTGEVDANGNRVFVTHTHGAYAGRPDAFMPQDWLDGEGTDLATRLQNVKPSSGMLHESLHTYDNYRLNEYNGVDQLHGAEVHGFGQNACGLPNEWICWYTNYIRSQIGENQSTQYGLHATNPVSPSQASMYVGVFNVMRGGRSAEQLWSYSKPISRLQNAGTQNCLDVAWADTADGAQILPWGCHSGANQQWSFRHVQNGVFHLVSENSQKCAELGISGLSQQTCSTTPVQRYILQSVTAAQFQIKTLGGECLAVSTTDQVVAEVCSDNAVRQRWQFN